MTIPIEKQIEDLAKVEISTELIDRLDINQISAKATQIIGALNISTEELDKLVNQGFFSSLFGSLFGGNDRILANTEKALVDSAKFNIGLSCLLVLFSKAIKNQQDKIVDQQNQLKAQQDELKIAHEKIRELQGLTKEQADSILQLLQAKDFVNNQIKDSEERQSRKLNDQVTEILRIVNTSSNDLVQKHNELSNLYNNVLARSLEHINKMEADSISQNKQFQKDLENISEQQSLELNALKSSFTSNKKLNYAVYFLFIVFIVLYFVRVI